MRVELASVWVLIFRWLLFPIGRAGAGVYLMIDRQAADHAPFIVVHPFTYDETGGEIRLKICPADPNFKDAVRTAIKLWNDLTPTTENCKNCFLLEDDPPSNSDAPYNLTSVILHELGHCAMGLGHTNWGETSYTATQTADVFDIGMDAIRGSRDDIVTPLPGARVVHWFRKTDNNPVVVDGLVIDESTYSRRFQDFPAGSTWSANNHLEVSQSLGFADTHGLMYSAIRQGARFESLDADTVSSVKFGMTGIDSKIGTPDDYTIRLVFHDDCDSADIVIAYFTPDPDDEKELATLGFCLSDIEQIARDNTVHYRVIQDPIFGTNPFLDISDSQKFDIIFGDDFESGGLSRWSD